MTSTSVCVAQRFCVILLNSWLTVKVPVFTVRFWMQLTAADPGWEHKSVKKERKAQRPYWRGQMSASCTVYRSSINTCSDWLAVRSAQLINSLCAPADKQEVIHCLTSQLALKADGWWGANKGTIRPNRWNCGQTAKRQKLKEEFRFPTRK